MAEYIGRQAAIEAIDESLKRVFVLPVGKSIMDKIPDADVRPVVTCGECKFWVRERISCEGLARCNTGESGVRFRNRNDFCSHGEKREES